MINLIDFVEESEFNGAKYKFFKPFQCETCGQEFDLDALTVSILLYGVFFTVGSEEGYAGLNCPKCLKTQLLKADIETLRLFYSSIGSFQVNLKYADGDKVSMIDFGHHYQSIGQYNLHKLKELTALDFSVRTHCVNQEDWKGFFYDERDMIMNKTMCSSFYFDSHPISGPTLSVLYARIEDIPKFVKIENDEGRRLIPRYIYSQPVYSLADKFCWDFDFESKHFEEQNAEFEKSIPNKGDRKKAAQEDAEALQREIDLGYIPADFKSSQYAITEPHEMQRFKNTAPSQFFSMMTQQADFLDLPSQDHVACKKIWGKIHPFKDTGVVKYFFNDGEFRDDREMPNYTIPEDETIKEVLELHSKNHGAEFLTKNYPNFINDYYKLLNTACCSFREVDDLRRRYLGLALEAMREDVMLEETARIEALNARQYAFFQEGDTWTIIFNGGTIRGLRTKGVRHLYYLAQRPFTYVKTIDLVALYGVNPDSIQGGNNLEKEPPQDESPEIYGQTGKKTASVNDKTDEEAIENYRRQLEEIRWERADAERDNDLLRIKNLNNEVIEINEKIQSVNKKRESSQFKDETFKIKDAVARAIRRAIKEIRGKKPDQTPFRHEVADHFQEALKPINSFDQRYRPINKVDWFFN